MEPWSHKIASSIDSDTVILDSSKNINFSEVTDIEKIKEVSPDGTVPILEVNGKRMVFKEALEWINGVK